MKSAREISISHVFDGKAFRRNRLPWLFFMMIPSLLLDAFLLYIVLVDYPQMLASGQIPAQDYAWECIKPFLVNVVLFKGGSVLWYMSLLYHRSLSVVDTSCGQVVYRRLTRSQKADNVSNDYYDTFTVVSVSRLTQRKNGTLDVMGTVIKQKSASIGEEPEKIKRQEQVTQCKIPGYFKDMAGITAALQSLKTEQL